MNIGRTSLSIALAGALVACGGGGGSSGGGGGPIAGPSPTPTPSPTSSTATCSVADRQQWVRGQMDTFYLFPDLLDTSVDPAAFNTVQGYLDALVAPARAQSRDRGFTFITSIEEENELINSGSNAGIGIRILYDSAQSRAFVSEAFENAPGFAAGLDRGTEILAIGLPGGPLVSVATLFAQGGAAAVSDAVARRVLAGSAPSDESLCAPPRRSWRT